MRCRYCKQPIYYSENRGVWKAYDGQLDPTDQQIWFQVCSGTSFRSQHEPMTETEVAQELLAKYDK